MLRSLVGRLRHLEARSQDTEAALGQGLSGVLAYARAHHIEAVPLASLTNAELAAQIADLTAQVAAGARGCTPLLLETLEEERAQRQAAVAAVHASGEADPCEGRKDLEKARPRP